MVRCPELLDLISRDREWNLTRNGVGSLISENNKLELRLGLPGEGSSCLNNNHENGEFPLSSAKPFPSCLNVRSNKRALYEKAEGMAGDEFQPHKLIFCEKTAEKVSPLTPSLSASLPSSAFQREAQKPSQPSQSSYLKRLLMPQKLDLVSEEPSKPCSLKTADLKSCLNSGSVPAESSEPKHHDKRLVSLSSFISYFLIIHIKLYFLCDGYLMSLILCLSKSTITCFISPNNPPTFSNCFLLS